MGAAAATSKQVRTNLVKAKVCVVGVESTGKTTLCRGLVLHYRCPWVQEYARCYLEGKRGRYTEKDLLLIAQAQQQHEEQAWRAATGLLVCDTNLLTIKIWQQEKYGRCFAWINEQWNRAQYDHYFLTQVQPHWTPDPLRELPSQADREQLQHRYEEALQEKTSTAHITRLRGGKAAQLAEAVGVVEQLRKKGL